MKIKTSKATPLQLNWLVAVCEGPGSYASAYLVDDELVYLDEAHEPTWEPSTNWSQGGPIIEREHISIIDCDGYDFWRADKMNAQAQVVTAYGPTPLIAAMRAYVASKLGDEVEIPEELT